MIRRAFLALLGSVMVAPLSAQAEPARGATTIAARLVGAWQFVSSVSMREDGSTVDRWGANSKGMFIFGSDGHFTQVIVGEESRLFGAKSFFAFGTYQIDEADKTIVTRIEGCSIAKLAGTEQRRRIIGLADGKLSYLNLFSSNGAKVEASWRRLKAHTELR